MRALFAVRRLQRIFHKGERIYISGFLGACIRASPKDYLLEISRWKQSVFALGNRLLELENPGDNGTTPVTRLAEAPVLFGPDISGVSTASSSKRKCSPFIQVVQQLDELSWREERDSKWQSALLRMILTWSDEVDVARKLRSCAAVREQYNLLCDYLCAKAPAALETRCRDTSHF